MTDFERQAVAFRNAYGSTASSFYRDLYREKQCSVSSEFPQTQADWASIPFLTKEDILAYPLWQRLFVPLEQVLTIRTSSGTSGRGLSLIPRERYQAYQRPGVTRTFCFQLHNGAVYLRFDKQGIVSVGGDPADMQASAKMAAAYAVDALEGTPSIICAFVPFLEKEYDCSNIRYLDLTDGPRAAQRDYLMKHFPRAQIGANIGMSEASGLVGNSCDWLDANMDNCVHLCTDMYAIEIIEPDTGTVVTGADAAGELVLTSLWDTIAFPIIRLRTGDGISRLREVCPLHPNEAVYQLTGRLKMDRFGIPGGVILKSELEGTLRSFEAGIGDDYQLHIFDVEREGSLRVRAELWIKKNNTTLSLEALARQLEDTLRVGPQRVYADGVARGLYEPLRCVLLPTEMQGSRPLGRIVRH